VVITLKLPEGYQLGLMFNLATGKQLDIYGEYENLKRKRWLIFKELDFLYKRRLIKNAILKVGE
jgi:hypothetical protein